jgi:predicted SAM-dependent methyltransferase
VLIHLGCGNVNSPEFINVDALPLPHVHYVLNVAKLSVFKDSYADLLYASHVLEHIPVNQVETVLAEWKRVIRPDGVLRLSVPDFDKLIDMYHEVGNKIFPIQCPLVGAGTKYTSHYSIFNETYLNELLSKVGFRIVRNWDPHKVDHHDFDDWASIPTYAHGKEFYISLNLEAVK